MKQVSLYSAVIAVLALCLLDAAWATNDMEPAPAGLDADAIAARVEETMRGERTYMEATMTIVSPRLPAPRVVKLYSWDDRPRKRTFIRILAPPKDAGTTFLELHPNLWMYVPRVERTIRIPPSMMLQSWMGSDFSNDDLARESSHTDDYDHRLIGIDPHPEEAPGLRAYVVEYHPHEDAPVVWGRIVYRVETEHSTPLRTDYYDEDGAHLRVMHFTDIRTVAGRHYPFRWRMIPLEKPGHETTIQVEKILFNQKFDETIFTTRNLKRRK